MEQFHQLYKDLASVVEVVYYRWTIKFYFPSEIDWSFTTPATNSGDIVYILGNPGGQELWRWTLGKFLNNRGDFLHIQSDVFGGNSGGPVLNKQGTLIGIVTRSDRHMNALAIPVPDINRLLSESQLKHSRSHK